MAKSSRSSTRKANNQRLKENVFGPVEDARQQRLAAKLLEIASQPKPVPEKEMKDTPEEDETKQNAADDSKTDSKRMIFVQVLAHYHRDADSLCLKQQWTSTQQPRLLNPRRARPSSGEARNRISYSPNLATGRRSRRRGDLVVMGSKKKDVISVYLLQGLCET